MLHLQFSHLPAAKRQVLALRKQPYVEAIIDSGRRRIVFHPIWPNTMAPIRVKISMDIEFVILSAANLSGIEISP